MIDRDIRRRLLTIVQILQIKNDWLDVKQIIYELKKRYSNWYEVERRSIYADLKSLEDFGWIELRRGRKTRPMQKSIQSILIYEKPYSLNNYRNEHFQKLNKIKIEWKNLVKLACLFHQIRPIKNCELRFIFYFKDKKRRDIDNYSATVKMVIDGLVHAGIITDDSYVYVWKVEMRIDIAKFEGVKVDIVEV